MNNFTLSNHLYNAEKITQGKNVQDNITKGKIILAPG